LQKDGILKYLLFFKKKIAFLKKINTLKKCVLFKYGSRSWRGNVFSKPVWETSNQIELNSQLAKEKGFINLNNRFKHYFNTSPRAHVEFSHKEINIKSRFNKIFYENRKIFEFIFNKKNLRQKKFNNYYSGWLKRDFFSILLTFELSLKNILLRSRFVFTDAQCDLLLVSKFVFVNGVIAVNKNLLLKIGDRIQLIVCNYYYFYFRQVLSDMIYLKKFLNIRV